MLFNLSAFGDEGATMTPPNNLEAKPKEFTVKLGSDYQVFSQDTEGGKVHYLSCRNKTIVCGYVWDELCEGGKAVAANPLGIPLPKDGKTPSTIYHPQLGLLRIFMCVNNP